jgi:hypothetical protein
MRKLDPDALDGLFDAIHGSVGQCRFEATTLRSTGLAVPAIRAAVERLHGRSLLREHLLLAHGIVFGRLTVGAHQLLSQRTILTEWTGATRWRLLSYLGSQWLTFTGADEPPPIELPPRIDHLVQVRLSHNWFRRPMAFATEHLALGMRVH